MPLDRRIAIQSNRGMANQHGEFVNNWVDVGLVWAERRGAGTYDVITAGSIREVAAVTWTTRYTSDLAALAASTTRIRDAAGALWNVNSIAQSDERRRFLTFTAVGPISG